MNKLAKFTPSARLSVSGGYRRAKDLWTRMTRTKKEHQSALRPTSGQRLEKPPDLLWRAAEGAPKRRRKVGRAAIPRQGSSLFDRQGARSQGIKRLL